MSLTCTPAFLSAARIAAYRVGAASQVFSLRPDLFEGWLGIQEPHTAIRKAQGEDPRYYELSVTHFQDAAQKPAGCLVLLRDVTRHLLAAEKHERTEQDFAQARQQILEKTSQLENAERELETFAYSVSHDLRAPLRGIDGYSKALLEDYGSQLDDLGKAYLQYIREASHHMAELIDDLLKLSRVMRSEFQLNQVDLSAMAAEIAVQLKALQPERQVTFDITPGMVVQADDSLLNILMKNLMDNAWKFTSQHASALIEVGRLDQEGRLVYYVRDDGAGFNMEYRDKLFTPFQRLHSAYEFEGSGIGLAIVQQIIKRHNGRVWAEGTVEKGATFFFTLQGDSL
jgi:light-regulated signal transduction histidine kinase (bacteriophytochrome)